MYPGSILALGLISPEDPVQARIPGGSCLTVMCTFTRPLPPRHPAAAAAVGDIACTDDDGRTSATPHTLRPKKQPKKKKLPPPPPPLPAAFVGRIARCPPCRRRRNGACGTSNATHACYRNNGLWASRAVLSLIDGPKVSSTDWRLCDRPRVGNLPLCLSGGRALIDSPSTEFGVHHVCLPVCSTA